MFYDLNKLVCFCVCAFTCMFSWHFHYYEKFFPTVSSFSKLSSYPHFCYNLSYHSHCAFIGWKRSELFDYTLIILPPFTYRKGTITYFLWSEYNQVFTLWQFNIVGKSFCLWICHRRMHLSLCNSLSKEPKRAIQVEKAHFSLYYSQFSRMK